jgi:YbbR domain-containing protein
MKIINNIRYFFSRIGKKIDKYIIVPITKLAVAIRKSLFKDSKQFEKVLSSKSSLLIITLVISIGLFIAVDSKTITMIETTAEVLYNQPVVVQYNEEAYVLQGVPETVDITLIGRNYDLYLAKQISEHEVTLDLSGLKPGVHEVALKYKRALDTINYKLDPSVVTVTILAKESEPRTIDVDLLNTDNLDPKLVIEKTNIDRDQVIVKGAEDVLKNVATVKALIDVNNFIDPKVGNLELTDIPLIAYDQSGRVMDVEIVPSKINASITITSPQKKVPVRFIPTGTLSFGKAISSINSNINELTIYGDQAVLDNINSIDAQIDVNGLREDKEVNLSLKRPVGVRYMSEAVANVKVTVGDETSKEFNNIPIQYENLGSKYAVTAKGNADVAVTVIVKGVSSVLESIDPSTIRAYVDLKDYGIGEHEVEVIVDRNDLRLTYVPKVKTVTLVISKKK